MGTKIDKLVDRLPILPESIHGADSLPAADWLGSDAKILPCVAQPQLNQELQELIQFSHSEKISLIPIGCASFRYSGTLALSKHPVLFVRPGTTSLWSGIDKINQTAWMPASMSVDEAERTLHEEGGTMSLWPQDSGSMGGNWVLPRGSFSSREFLAPASRRLGVEALMSHGEWMRVPEAPRSAAGPNMARFMAGFGGDMGFVTRVRVAVRPFKGARTGAAKVTDLRKTLENLRMLVMQDRLPSAVTLQWDGSAGNLWWKTHVTSTWDEGTYKTAESVLGLEDGDKEPCTSTNKIPVSLTWKALFDLADSKSKSFPTVLAGPTPSGMVSFTAEPAPLSATWQGWIKDSFVVPSDRAEL